MAEHAAHLTTTLQAKPSIFEVVAADSLQATFNPAIKRLCTSLATINPERFGFLLRFYDEFFLVLNGLVQQHYIRVDGGSLAEVFYGLTRTLTRSNKLSKRAKNVTFFVLVLLPYIRLKIEKLFNRWTEQIETNPAEVQSLKLKSKTIQAYKTLVTMYEFLQIFQYISYMANISKSHSLMLRLLRMNLTFLPPEEQRDDWTWTDFLKGNIQCSTMLTTLLFRGLELSAFFLQFVQWWQTEANHGDITNLPVPDPPDYDPNSMKYAGKCPICLQVWQIPTVISISGYVYCYKCIVKHFELSRQCPVTNYPAGIDDLLRIYDD